MILGLAVEGLDYFRKDQRDMKRWRFIRKVMRRSLVVLKCRYENNIVFC